MKENHFQEPEHAFSFSRYGALLSSREFFTSAESLTAAFTWFFLQARTVCPSAHGTSHLRAQVSYTRHLNRHLGTELLHGCRRQAAARIPREDPSLYIAVQIWKGHEPSSFGKTQSKIYRLQATDKAGRGPFLSSK